MSSAIISISGRSAFRTRGTRGVSTKGQAFYITIGVDGETKTPSSERDVPMGTGDIWRNISIALINRPMCTHFWGGARVRDRY